MVAMKRGEWTGISRVEKRRAESEGRKPTPETIPVVDLADIQNPRIKTRYFSQNQLGLVLDLVRDVLAKRRTLQSLEQAWEHLGQNGKAKTPSTIQPGKDGWE